MRPHLRESEFPRVGLEPHHGRHRALEHDLIRPRRPTVTRPGSGGFRRSARPCRTPRMGAYRSDRRLRLDRGESRRAVSAATRGSFYVGDPMMHPEGLELSEHRRDCAGVPLRYASDRHSAWWVTSLTISAVTAADGDRRSPPRPDRGYPALRLKKAHGTHAQARSAEDTFDGRQIAASRQIRGSGSSGTESAFQPAEARWPPLPTLSGPSCPACRGPRLGTSGNPLAKHGTGSVALFEQVCPGKGGGRLC